ncbi:MAG: extracellular matrix/biofilm biosynthesis regulator RemA family protein [Cyanobacteria bacterium P01_F01_bin.4]
MKPSKDISLTNIGFGNVVSAIRIVAVVSPESAPIKHIITEARQRNQLVEATYDRRTRAVMLTDSGHVILSSIQRQRLYPRL